MELLIVTGMAGAGRRSVLSALEDMGCVALDNVPTQLLESLLDLEAKLNPGRARMAVGMDNRHEAFAQGFGPLLDRLAERSCAVQVIFAEAGDDVLLRRYSESRRPHHLSPDGNLTAGFARERLLLAPLKERATLVIDTSRLTLSQLRQRLSAALPDLPGLLTTLRLCSFGYKHGLPQDADTVFDARFLPNPFYIAELRSLTGMDAEVKTWLLGSENFVAFLDRLEGWIRWSWPLVVEDARAYHTVSIGCTGGQHRSVALVELLAERLKDDFPRVVMLHRELKG
jgi:UPF0042 nucleotide-binding protein